MRDVKFYTYQSVGNRYYGRYCHGLYYADGANDWTGEVDHNGSKVKVESFAFAALYAETWERFESPQNGRMHSAIQGMFRNMLQGNPIDMDYWEIDRAYRENMQRTEQNVFGDVI